MFGGWRRHRKADPPAPVFRPWRIEGVRPGPWELTSLSHGAERPLTVALASPIQTLEIVFESFDAVLLADEGRRLQTLSECGDHAIDFREGDGFEFLICEAAPFGRWMMREACGTIVAPVHYAIHTENDCVDVIAHAGSAPSCTVSDRSS